MTVWHQAALASLCGAIACGQTPVQAHDSDDSAARTRLDDDDCQSCHDDAARGWARSRHHRAFTNPQFVRSFAREPRQFCRDCHAPAVARAEPVDAKTAESLGVGCLDCHGVDGQDDVRTGPGDEVDAPHGLVRVATFGTDSCARCHEFDFPESSRRPRGTMMQRTMSEHRASPWASNSCASCHLPATAAGTHDHGVTGGHDASLLRGALNVTASRDGDDVVLTLEPQGVGHAFPTGDLFRRLEVGAELNVDGVVRARATRYLTRHFEPWRNADGTRNPAHAWPVVDDRLTGDTTLRLALPGSGDENGIVQWWVDYQRVDARDDLAPERSSLAGQVRLDQGQLLWRTLP